MTDYDYEKRRTLIHLGIWGAYIVFAIVVCVVVL